jgi:hypothetical protein
MDFYVGKLVEFSIGFFAELLDIFLGDRVTGSAEQVHSGHAVVAHGGMERMVKSLHIHGDTLDLFLNEPPAGLHPGAAGIVIVLFGIIEFPVHAGIETEYHAFQLIRLDACFFTSCFEMFRSDEPPAFNLDWQADGFTGVGVDRHLMGIPGSFTIELDFHDVTGSIAVSTGMHGAGNILRQNTAFCHCVIIIDYRFVKIWPAWYFRTERVRQINEYFFPHD